MLGEDLRGERVQVVVVDQMLQAVVPRSDECALALRERVVTALECIRYPADSPLREAELQLWRPRENAAEDPVDHGGHQVDR